MGLISSYERDGWDILPPLLSIYQEHAFELRQSVIKANYLNVLDILEQCRGSQALMAMEIWAQLAEVTRMDVPMMRMEARAVISELQDPDSACEWPRCPLYGCPPTQRFWCHGCYERFYCSELCQQRCVSCRRSSVAHAHEWSSGIGQTNTAVDVNLRKVGADGVDITNLKSARFRCMSFLKYEKI